MKSYAFVWQKANGQRGKTTIIAATYSDELFKFKPLRYEWYKLEE